MSVDSSPNQNVAGRVVADRPRFLEGIGSAVVSLTFYVLRKSRHLPCLVGPVIGVVEDIVSPCIQPLATKVGAQGLYLLSIADEKLYTLGEITMENIPLVAGLVDNAKEVCNILGQVTTVASCAYDQVRDRGVIGAAADTWVKYEVTVKSMSADSLKVVKRIPLLSAFVPVICTVGTPVASAFSSWLAKHSELQDKHLVLHEVHLLDDEKDSKNIPEEEHLFVVDDGALDSSSMDTRKNNREIDFAEYNSIPESSESSTHLETVKKSLLFEEAEEKKPVQGETTGKGQSNVITVNPVSSADDSDDELTVLFESSWHLGKIGSPRQIVVEPKESKKRWW